DQRQSLGHAPRGAAHQAGRSAEDLGAAQAALPDGRAGGDRISPGQDPGDEKQRGFFRFHETRLTRRTCRTSNQRSGTKKSWPPPGVASPETGVPAPPLDGLLLRFHETRLTRRTCRTSNQRSGTKKSWPPPGGRIPTDSRAILDAPLIGSTVASPEAPAPRSADRRSASRRPTPRVTAGNNLTHAAV